MDASYQSSRYSKNLALRTTCFFIIDRDTQVPGGVKKSSYHLQNLERSKENAQGSGGGNNFFRTSWYLSIMINNKKACSTKCKIHLKYQLYLLDYHFIIFINQKSSDDYKICSKLAMKLIFFTFRETCAQEPFRTLILGRLPPLGPLCLPGREKMLTLPTWLKKSLVLPS